MLGKKTAGLIAAACAAMICGCSTTTPPEAAPVAAAPAEKSAPAPAPAAAAPAPVVAATPDYLDPRSPVSSQRSVYFGFDDSTVQTKDRNVVEVQGNYLKAHPGVSVRIEGNTDERGSAEYNLALGQRRAQAMVNALKVYGVKDTQMEAVSWGKEKPRAGAHEESAWSQNRRADVVYPSK